jgi:peptidylprolyl isomerase
VNITPPRVLALAVALMALSESPALGGAQQVSVFAAPPDLKAPPADAVTGESGLASKVITPGTGDGRPAPTDVVTVHYTAWSADSGGMHDSTLAREKPAMLPLDGAALPGWRECVALMVIGEKRRCWMPEKLAYGGAANRPAGMMVFDIELLDIWPSPLIPPPDINGPPPDARRTSSGLAYKVLRPGTGARNPGPSDRITVHYSGWTTNGRLFDSSITRGEPLTLGLREVIRGWGEGLELMVEGERTRLWVPQDLAYKGEQGAPAGMLVFDVELIEIE